MTAVAWVILTIFAFMGVVLAGHHIMERGITKHEFSVFGITLAGILAIALAHIVGVRFDGAVRFSINAPSWIAAIGPVAIAGIAVALLRGRA